MIINTTNNNVINSGCQSKTFSFKNSAKGFKIIANNLYSCKPSAILREIGQNCFDSHVQARKKNVPFKVKLPNYWNPQLVIRDFGVSMTHEFMMNEYTQAFNSTKEDSNRFAGAWGIGRLSPLTISDNFCINCFKGGKKRSYSIFHNEQECPEISFLGECDTGEEDGVEITVNIPNNFLDSFIDKSREVFRFFNPKPQIEDLEIDDINYKMQGDGWGVTGDGGQSYAIMGCYGYKINPYSITNLLDSHRGILNSGVAIEFKIGELEVNASREALTYSEKTISAIKGKLSKISEEVNDIILEKFKELKTIWDVKLLYRDLFDNYGSLRFLKSGNSMEIEWGGEKIKDWHIPLKKYEKIAINLLQRPRRGNVKNYQIHSIVPRKDPTFILNDLKMKRGIGSRIAHLDLDSLFFINYDSLSDVQGFCDEMGLDINSFKKISDYPPIKENRNYSISEYAATRAFVLKDIGGRRFEDRWSPIQINLKKESGFYLLVDHKQVVGGLDNKISNLDVFGIDITKTSIYLFKRSEHEKLKKYPNLVYLLDFMKDFVCNNIKNNPQGFVDYLAYLNSNPSKYFRYTYGGETFEKILPSVGNGIFKTNISKFLSLNDDNIRKMFSTVSNILSFSTIISEMGIQLPPTYNAGDLLREVEKEYPILRYISDIEHKQIINYINLVDEYKTLKGAQKTVDNATAL